MADPRPHSQNTEIQTERVPNEFPPLFQDRANKKIRIYEKGRHKEINNQDKSDRAEFYEKKSNQQTCRMN